MRVTADFIDIGQKLERVREWFDETNLDESLEEVEALGKQILEFAEDLEWMRNEADARLNELHAIIEDI